MLLRHAGTIALSLGSAAAIGWIAFQLQQQAGLPSFLFPLIFPLAVGIAAGGGCVAIDRLLPAVSRLLPVIALVAGIIVVASQTWFSYRLYAAEIDRQLSSNALAIAARAQTDDFGPRPLHEFVAAQIDRSNGWWLMDAALTVFASATFGWVLRAKPSAARIARSEISNLKSQI